MSVVYPDSTTAYSVLAIHYCYFVKFYMMSHHQYNKNNPLNSANSIQSRSGLNTITSHYDYEVVPRQSAHFNVPINNPNYQRQMFPHPHQIHPSQQIHYPQHHNPHHQIPPHHHNSHNGHHNRSQNSRHGSTSAPVGTARQINPTTTVTSGKIKTIHPGISVQVCLHMSSFRLCILDCHKDE